MYLFFSQRDKEFRIVFYSTLLYKYVWNSVQTLEFLSCPVMKCYVYNQLCFPSYSYVGIGGVFGLPRWLSGNDCLPMQGDGGLILGLGRSTGEGSGNPLQYSCLENPMDREAWQATIHRVSKGQMWLKWLNTYMYLEMITAISLVTIHHHTVTFIFGWRKLKICSLLNLQTSDIVNYSDHALHCIPSYNSKFIHFDHL